MKNELGIELRPYQIECIHQLRLGLKEGFTRQILCSPCGSGKTLIAGQLILDSIDKGSRSLFIVDRTTLVRQTSERFYEYGIPHGVIWAGNSHSPYQSVQVCSAQTLEARGYIPRCDFIVFDEAHIKRKKMLEFAANTGVPVIGLTATPFTKGLGDFYQNIVNVTSTNQLINERWLVPLKVFAAREKEIDMKGARTDNSGEWTNKEVRERGAKIIGDIVTEWEVKTRKIFGGPVKTLVFSADVAHGEQLRQEFEKRGHKFEQVSYLEPDEDKRNNMIRRFRNGETIGLISCDALGRGFDVPDVLCMSTARPYRRSLASHIQQIGRLMRPSPGKEFGLLLDHSGNWLGHMDATLEFFANGAENLDETTARAVRKEGEERTVYACPQCGLAPDYRDVKCAECGYYFPAKKQPSYGGAKGPEFAPGELVEIDYTVAGSREWKYDREWTWKEICNVTLNMCNTVEKAQRTAFTQYRTLYGEKPPNAFVMHHETYPDRRVERRVKKQLAEYRKSQQKAAA